MQSGKYSVTVILVNTKNISMNWLLFIEPGLFWWLTHTGIWLLKTSSFETLRHFVPRCTAFTFKSRDRMCAIRPSPTVWSGSWRRHQIGLTCWSFSKLRLSYDVHILPLGRCDRLVFVLQCGSRSAKYIFRRVQMVVWILYSVFCSRRITYCFFSSPNQLMWWWYSILTRLFFLRCCLKLH